MRCLESIIIKEILRLHELGFNYREIADKAEPNRGEIHNRLTLNKRVNIQYIWEEEYRREKPDGYSYSRFCALYAEWKNHNGKKVVMPQEREPGKELFSDWIGDKLPCVVDTETSEIKEAHFFVTTLGDKSI